MNYEIIQLNENTWSIEDDFVRMFLLVGAEKALLLDSGADLENVKEIVSSITDKPVELLNTHGDGDHTYGNKEFDYFYIAEPDYINIHMKEKYKDSVPRFVKEGDEFDLGNRTIHIYEIPGHTYGSIAILDVKNRQIFAGDSVQDGHVFMFGDERNPAIFSDALLKLDSLKDKFDVIHPSHDTVTLTPDSIMKVYEDWQKVLRKELTPVKAFVEGAWVHTYEGEFCGFHCNIESECF